MSMPHPLPLSATMGNEELALYHETIPLTVSGWDVSPAQYDALIANLDRTRCERLSMKQHRRLSAIIQIAQKLSPAPLFYDDASAAVLLHPGTAPCGSRRAIDVMCSGLEGLEAVAQHFHALPHGPWLLPNVLHHFVEAWWPHTRWYLELLEDAERMSMDRRTGPAERALARRLGRVLPAEAFQEGVREQRDVGAPVAQRRQADGEGREAVIQVRPELFVAHALHEVAVGRGDQAKGRMLRLDAAHAPA